MIPAFILTLQPTYLQQNPEDTSTQMEYQESPPQLQKEEEEQQPPHLAIEPKPDIYPLTMQVYEGPQLPSTYRLEHIRDDIVLGEQHVIYSNILQGTPIYESMRAKIRKFLMSEGSKLLVMRDTLALACTQIDLFFRNGGFCSVEDFQIMSLACLILAMKIQEGKFPKISFKVFRKEQLLNWEKKVAKRLLFHLSPPTYYTFALHLVTKWTQWEHYTSIDSTFKSDFLSISHGFNPTLRRFYEQLDCIFMVMKSLSWPLEMLVVNLFYLHIRMSCLQLTIDTEVLPAQEFTAIFYSPDDFRIYFDSFLLFYTSRVVRIEPSLGLYLKHFLVLQPSTRVFALRPSVEELRVWDKLQTFPSDSYSLSKSIMERVNPVNYMDVANKK